MMQIDNSQKTKALYEQILRDFNSLNKVTIPEFGALNPVNAFYLYNLIVNKDGFGQASLTRLFEDLVASGDNSLWVVDYNNWIDQQNPQELANTFLKRDPNDSMAERAEVILINAANENVETIGFKSEENTSLDRDYNDSTIDTTKPILVSNGNEQYRQVRFNIPKTDISVEEALKIAKIIEVAETKADRNNEEIDSYIDFDYYKEWGTAESVAELFEDEKVYNITNKLISEHDILVDEFDNINTSSKNLISNTLKHIIFNSGAFVRTDPNQLTLFDNGPTKFYDLKTPMSTKITELVKNVNSLQNVRLVTDQDVINEDTAIKNAKGFIKEGIIYINIDRATDDTLIHEFSHLYLADARNMHAESYYKILGNIQDTELWNRMRQNPYYRNKKGSDFDEEVLATMITDYYNGYIKSDAELEIIDEILSIANPELKAIINSGEIMPFYDSFIHENYKLSQKVATVKNKLMNDDIIKEDCK